MSCWHQHQQKAWRKRWRCLCFSHPPPAWPCPCTLCKPPLLLPHPLTARKTCHAPLIQISSQHWVLILAHFSVLQPILPFKPFHGRFPLPLSQSTTIPWTVTRVFVFWQDILSSALAHLRGLFLSLPTGIHGCSHQSLIPAMPDRPTQPCRRWGELPVGSIGHYCSDPSDSSSSSSSSRAAQASARQGTHSVNADHTVSTLPGSWAWGRFPSPMQLRAAKRVPLVGELTGRNLGAECWSNNKDVFQ